MPQPRFICYYREMMKLVAGLTTWPKRLAPLLFIVFALLGANIVSAAHQLEHAIEDNHHIECQLGQSFAGVNGLIESHVELVAVSASKPIFRPSLFTSCQQRCPAVKRCRSPPSYNE
ncbi:hypothetical protein DBZ36_19650 [Alginatibacterium sediminis]|uniref:Uncharacterized protein n=1 Tax=Alginatibacterium sediminis TaxID=2164068 RepID=A0A420E658_9ALTE|nr:hypothetical protein [Alginatibacterium sediminis]RKF13274.1 hypothetical protein DBZ36_19650 [Alginatibacterium sediminis]